MCSKWKSSKENSHLSHWILHLGVNFIYIYYHILVAADRVRHFQTHDMMTYDETLLTTIIELFTFSILCLKREGEKKTNKLECKMTRQLCVCVCRRLWQRAVCPCWTALPCWPPLRPASTCCTWATMMSAPLWSRSTATGAAAPRSALNSTGRHTSRVPTADNKKLL